MRRLNTESEDEIKFSEELRLTGYKDSGGVPTIGWGHTGLVDGKPVRVGMKISRAKAQELFEQDTGIAGDAVMRAVKVKIDDYQYGALTSWTLNVGVGAMQKSTLIKKLNAGDYDSVPREFMKWVNDNGKRVPGLVNRRARDAALWAKGSHHPPLGVMSTNAEKAPPNIAPRDVIAAVGLGGSGIAGGAAGNGLETLNNIKDTVVTQQNELSSGDLFRIVIAVVIVGLTLWAFYRYRQSQ